MSQLFTFAFRIVLTVHFITISLFSQSQDVVYSYGAVFAGNSTTAYPNGIVVDANGNTYTVGYFTGTTDFDPGPGTANLSSAAGSSDGFICKLDATGHYVWARQLGSTTTDNASDIAIDANGHLYITGTFTGAVDFDPGPGTAILGPRVDISAYIWKLDGDGNYIFATSPAGRISPTVAIAVDLPGNIYLTGRFTSDRWSTFSTASGSIFMGSAGANDIFVQKLDASGNGIWAKRMGGTHEDIVYDISVDATGNVYTTGFCLGAADFDPGPGTAILSPFGVFISKLDPDGNYGWVKQLQASYGSSLTNDASGNIYITGSYYDSVDFDPGAGTAYLKTVGSYDIFILKLDPAGNYNWAKSIGGAGSDWMHAITMDAGGNLYTTGYFQGTADFDPGPGTASLTATSADNPDVFVSKLDASGNYVFAKSIGGTLREEGWGIAATAAGNVYTTGYFNGTMDMDPGAGTAFVTSAAGQGMFVSKLVPVTGAPLPLSWLNVGGHLNTQQQAVINWHVQETSVQEYTIEKSTDGIGFNTIGSVAGKRDGQHHYSFTERAALQKSAWYRIKQIDVDGRSGYSVLVRLATNSDRLPVTVYPVPARESFTIQVNEKALLNTKAILVDVSGRPLKIISINDYNTQVNIADLPHGMYVLQLVNGSRIKVARQ